ncbi:MAG: alpha/beta hydrolase [Proteobacteria bacterium]|nr:MAG: alpha/beta hydrolase [Pseudomonadota bacterium]
MEFRYAGHRVFAGVGRQSFDPAKRMVVFIHGAGLDHTVWLVFERYFARRGFNVLALDLPAHGRSDGEPLSRIEAMAEWVDGLLDQFGVNQAALVGHSLGSLIAFECAARNPDRITNVVLLGFSYPMVVSPPLLDAARHNDPAAIDMMVIYGHDFRSQLGGNRVSGVHIVNCAKRLLAKNPPGVLFADLNACNEYHNGDAAAAMVRCPAVFISGDRDKMTSPRAAAEMAQRVVNGTASQVKNSGHSVMAEQPEQTHQLLVQALSA